MFLNHPLLWLHGYFTSFMPFLQVFFLSHNELDNPKSRMVATHYDLDIAHAPLVFPDFALIVSSCPPSPPIFSLFLLNFLIFVIFFILHVFPIVSSLITVIFPKLPTQQAPKTHLWLVPSHLGLFCRIRPWCLSEFLEIVLCSMYFFFNFGFLVHNLLHRLCEYYSNFFFGVLHC